MTSTVGNLSMLSSIRTDKKNFLADLSYQEIVFALQTTLEIDKLLDIFSLHLQSTVPHDGYSFHLQEHEFDLSAGKSGRHSCSYTLMLENETLGEWKLTRGKRFSDRDLSTVEAFLCRLLYPLRNALKYWQAMHTASIDPLTQTRNRAALADIFQREWELSNRHGTALSLIMLDVDHFKRINDDHGHDKGDSVLRSVAQCLRETVRTSDMVFRYGGEEFVVLLSNTDGEGALHLGERIRRALERLCLKTEADTPLPVTASLGVATLTTGESKEKLLKRADMAMYKAKNLGRNRVVRAEYA